MSKIKDSVHFVVHAPKTVSSQQAAPNNKRYQRKNKNQVHVKNIYGP